MAELFYNIEIISFLEKRNFEHFVFRNGCAYINSHEADEIIIEAPDNQIPDERIQYVIDVLYHFDECVRKAHGWLEHISLKNDKWYPHALDQGFEVYGLFFGTFMYGHEPDPVTNGFTLSFQAAGEYFPCKFTVKFCRNDMHPFAVEEWLE